VKIAAALAPGLPARAAHFGSFVTDPPGAFMALRSHPTFLAPLLALALGFSTVLAWYYSRLDIAWFVDQVLGQQPALGAAQQAAVRDHVSRTTLLAGAVAGICLGIPALRILEAIYFRLAGKILDAGGSFKAWLGFVCWSSLPELLALPMMILDVYAAPDGRLLPERLDGTSLNALVLRLEPGSDWAAIACFLSLPLLLKLALLATGLRTWSASPWAICIVLALAPYVAVLGAWAGLIALRT
jgi:Yip1 domain